MHSPSGVSRQNVWIEKKHQVSSCIKSQKTERNKKTVESNPRKEAVTTNSWWFTQQFNYWDALPDIRKLLLLYLLMPQSEAVIKEVFHVWS